MRLTFRLVMDSNLPTERNSDAEYSRRLFEQISTVSVLVFRPLDISLPISFSRGGPGGEVLVRGWIVLVRGRTLFP
jgi:hypothetical protein